MKMRVYPGTNVPHIDCTIQEVAGLALQRATMRREIATAVLAGILAGDHHFASDTRAAVELADILLARLEEPPTP